MSEMDNVSYILGMNVATQIKSLKLDINVDKLAEGFRDEYNGDKIKLSNEEIQEAFKRMDTLAREAQAAAKADAGKAAEERLEIGRAFLKENAEKEGVKVTESGLQYKVIESGDGASPTAADTVETHYEGTLIEGTVFDSSYQRGETISFPVGGVIKGWQEALQLMSVGDKWELYIPSELAYGANGAGGAIGPHETLIFKIELINIV